MHGIRVSVGVSCLAVASSPVHHDVSFVSTVQEVVHHPQHAALFGAVALAMSTLGAAGVTLSKALWEAMHPPGHFDTDKVWLWVVGIMMMDHADDDALGGSFRVLVTIVVLLYTGKDCIVWSRDSRVVCIAPAGTSAVW